jgi:hypothetical protein
VVWEGTDERASRSDSEAELAREWLLDRVLEAAAARRAGVVLRLPSPHGPDALQLHTTLHRFVCRYAPLPALASWELATTREIAEAARQFLQAYDPYHPIVIDPQG